jgi:hypothetical protein
MIVLAAFFVFPFRQPLAQEIFWQTNQARPLPRLFGADCFLPPALPNAFAKGDFLLVSSKVFLGFFTLGKVGRLFLSSSFIVIHPEYQSKLPANIT